MAEHWGGKTVISADGQFSSEDLIELCDRGFLTCTRGNPGEYGATYALAWLPLDNPELYSSEVRERHSANMEAFALK